MIDEGLQNIWTEYDSISFSLPKSTTKASYEFFSIRISVKIIAIVHAAVAAVHDPQSHSIWMRDKISMKLKIDQIEVVASLQCWFIYLCVDGISPLRFWFQVF